MVFDLIFLAVFVWAAYRGFTKGFVIQAATFAALVIGIFGAVKFSGYTTAILAEKTKMDGEYLPIISFALTFIAIVILVHLLSRVLEKLIDAVALGFVNRLAGAIFSLIKFTLIMSGILVVLNTINEHSPFLPVEEVEKSKLYRPLSSVAPSIFPYLKYENAKEFIEEVEVPSELKSLGSDSI